MKDLSRQILSLILISTILLGIIGVNLHHHVCGATGSHYVFLDNPDDPCGKESSCCESEESSSCCSSKSNDCTDASIEHDCCSDYIQTIELEVKTFTETAKKVLKRAITFVYVFISINSAEDNDNNEHFINSEDYQVIKVPIQKVISYIHISTRSAYSS